MNTCVSIKLIISLSIIGSYMPALVYGQQVIIFDLGGVLLQEPERNLDRAYECGLLSERLENVRLFNRIFECAALALGQECKKAWFLGIASGHEIVAGVRAVADNPVHDTFFRSATEKEQIMAIAPLVLLPESLAQLTTLYRDGFEVVQKYAAQGIRLIILSNWDPASFALIKNAMPELFSLFREHDIFIPERSGLIKPEQKAYTYLLEIAGVQAQDCFFVDDSSLNVEAAKMCGMRAVMHQDWEMTQRALQELGLKSY